MALPPPSATMTTVASVERYGAVWKPFGNSCAKVAIVGITKSPVTGLANFSFSA